MAANEAAPAFTWDSFIGKWIFIFRGEFKQH
jgi:hypothetical protein